MLSQKTEMQRRKTVCILLKTPIRLLLVAVKDASWRLGEVGQQRQRTFLYHGLIFM